MTRYSAHMEEKREPDIIEETEPERLATDPEPTGEQRATARPVGLTVPPPPSTVRNALGRSFE